LQCQTIVSKWLTYIVAITNYSIESCPYLRNVISFRGRSPPDPLPRGFAPGPHWGLCPQTPIIGSRSALAMGSPASDYQESSSSSSLCSCKFSLKYALNFQESWQTFVDIETRSTLTRDIMITMHFYQLHLIKILNPLNLIGCNLDHTSRQLYIGR